MATFAKQQTNKQTTQPEARGGRHHHDHASCVTHHALRGSRCVAFARTFYRQPGVLLQKKDQQHDQFFASRRFHYRPRLLLCVLVCAYLPACLPACRLACLLPACLPCVFWSLFFVCFTFVFLPFNVSGGCSCVCCACRIQQYNGMAWHCLISFGLCACASRYTVLSTHP